MWAGCVRVDGDGRRRRVGGFRRSPRGRAAVRSDERRERQPRGRVVERTRRLRRSRASRGGGGVTSLGGNVCRRQQVEIRGKLFAAVVRRQSGPHVRL